MSLRCCNFTDGNRSFVIHLTTEEEGEISKDAAPKILKKRWRLPDLKITSCADITKEDYERKLDHLCTSRQQDVHFQIESHGLPPLAV